jgi:hypothetical protein
MSGVGVSGLIANLPSTITPYPTQDPALELGGYRSVANATARDAIPANFRSLGMEVTLQSTGATYTLFGGLTNANWKLVDAPFVGTFCVDPTFTGPQLGSTSNPFTTIAAAFAAAVAASITHGIVYLAPGANCVENVTFPLTGDWEIAGLQAYGLFVTKITGNVDISSSASARRTLRSIQVTGNLTGNCSAGTQRILCTEGVSINGTTTLTVTGAGIQRLGSGTTDLDFSGTGIQANFFTGAVSIQGQFCGSSAYFATSLALSMSSSFINCLMPPLTTFNTAGGLTMWFQGCANDVGGSLGFTVAGGGFVVFSCDGVTLEEFCRVGTNITGDIRMQSMLGGRSSSSDQITNVGASPLTGKLPKGMMTISACLTLLTNAGATAGNAVLNVIYTDATGTLVTEAVTTALNVAGAVGSKARGVLPFSQNGATAVSWSVTGITNATSLSYRCDVAIHQTS